MRATHKGECQICGRTQKLPGGRLSNHGYTTRWGFFSGTCPGSRELPFELSCDLIAAAACNARIEAQATLNNAAAHRKGSGPLMARLYLPDPSDSWGRKAYRWVRIERVEQRRTEVTLHLFDGGTKRIYTYTSQPYERELREARAVHFENHARQLTEYARWQEGRVNTWKRRELQPV